MYDDAPLLAGFKFQLPTSRAVSTHSLNRFVLSKLDDEDSTWLRKFPDYLSRILCGMVRNHMVARSFQENMVMLYLMDNYLHSRDQVWSVHPLLSNYYVDHDSESVQYADDMLKGLFDQVQQRNAVTNFWLFRPNPANQQHLLSTFKSTCCTNHNGIIRQLNCIQHILCHLLGEVLHLPIPHILQLELTEFDYNLLRDRDLQADVRPTSVAMKSYIIITKFLQNRHFMSAWTKTFYNNPAGVSDNKVPLEEAFAHLQEDENSPLHKLRVFLENFNDTYIQPEPTPINLRDLCSSYSSLYQGIYERQKQDTPKNIIQLLKKSRNKDTNSKCRNHLKYWNLSLFRELFNNDLKLAEEHRRYRVEAITDLSEIIQHGHPLYFSDRPGTNHPEVFDLTGSDTELPPPVNNRLPKKGPGGSGTTMESAAIPAGTTMESAAIPASFPPCDVSSIDSDIRINDERLSKTKGSEKNATTVTSAVDVSFRADDPTLFNKSICRPAPTFARKPPPASGGKTTEKRCLKSTGMDQNDSTLPHGVNVSFREDEATLLNKGSSGPALASSRKTPPDVRGGNGKAAGLKTTGLEEDEFILPSGVNVSFRDDEESFFSNSSSPPDYASAGRGRTMFAAKLYPSSVKRSMSFPSPQGTKYKRDYVSPSGKHSCGTVPSVSQESPASGTGSKTTPSNEIQPNNSFVSLFGYNVGIAKDKKGSKLSLDEYTDIFERSIMSWESLTKNGIYSGITALPTDDFVLRFHRLVVEIYPDTTVCGDSDIYRDIFGQVFSAATDA